LLPIHPGGRFFAHTLWYLLTRDIGKVHIATRLDRETSGLVLAAKDAGTARYLQEQQGLGAIHKTYLALVHGCFPAGPKIANGWLIPDLESVVRKKRRFVSSTALEDPGLGPGTESCKTVFATQGSWLAEDGERSRVEARLLTGRTHQIRASLLSLGYPVVGDKLYGLDERFFLRFLENSLTDTDLTRLVLPYQALHCGKLEFLDPDGVRLAFSTPAPWNSLVGVSGTRAGC
jgi:23S rRNA pseudouridine955/2504/2580 synthase/23S rRNA pseudouridine1911/1915/1917 synthase